jgi:two-component system, chemotaxis family, chemotaxis protein CheY
MILESHMKVLIIEDNEAQAKLLKKIVLKIKDIDPIIARDSFEGYVILRAIPDIKLIILDYQMPYVDGIKFLKKIRSTPPFNDIQVIISSSEDLTDDYIAAGANKVMIKPYDLSELNEYIAAFNDKET